MTRPYASSLINHNVIGNERRTSLRLEPAFWSALKDLADEDGSDISAVVRKIEAEPRVGSLTSAVRVHVLSVWMARGELGEPLK
jgi:predicted DNA-binding ribbon-helix-helix protein